MTAAAASAGRTSPYAIFRSRDFSLLWSSQLVSELGSSITALAAGIYVYKISGSVVNLSLMMIASVAPSLLVGLFAGVFVDRYDRKRIMLVTSLLRGLLVLAIPFLIPYNLAWMYVLVFLSGAVGQFFNPAQSSVLPDVASEEELNAANSLMAISTYGSLVLGYGMSGFFVEHLPIEWAFYTNALTFLACALLIAAMHVPAFKVEEQTSARVVLGNLSAGARFIADTPILRSLFIIFALVFINFGFLNALRLPFTIEALNGSASTYGLLEGLTLIGFVAASLWMATCGRPAAGRRVAGDQLHRHGHHQRGFRADLVGVGGLRDHRDRRLRQRPVGDRALAGDAAQRAAARCAAGCSATSS